MSKIKTIKNEPREQCEKTCILCQHWTFESAEHGYSEYTPGDEFEEFCRKDVWYFDKYEDTQASRRAYLLSAQTCEHFEMYTKESE